MQITKRFCAVTATRCGLGVLLILLCQISHGIAGSSSSSGVVLVGHQQPDSAEIISGRPKISYDIKSLSGEPAYKSVNLTWEIEEVVQLERDEDVGERVAAAAATSLPLSLEHAFVVYYCEMQSWGPQRCKSKVLKESHENHIDSPSGEIEEDDDDEDHRNGREYSMIIDNLRMATKYSFHVRQLPNAVAGKPKGREIVDDEEEEPLDANEIDKGQTIIIPTKGFSAHATKCLAHASEIEVETGPYFGGKIIVENSDCVIEGDAESPKDTYTMQIDHDRCGSHVFHNNLTVVTTVITQENQGIFTHSTRRFMVVCSYHPETLTVRASFMVPGKGGAAAATSPEWQKIAQPARNGRERQFKLVGRNALVLKENDPESDTGIALLESEGSDYQYPAQVTDVENSIAGETNGPTNHNRANYLRLVHEQHGSSSSDDGETINPRGRESDRLTGILIAASVSVIMVGSVVYLLLRETKKQRIAQAQRVIRIAQP